VTDFTKTVIIMTSNVGARSLADAAGDNNSFGFQGALHEHMTPKEIKEISMSAARRKFTPEFLNRLDEIVTFNTLTKEQIEEVLGMELAKVQVKFMMTGANTLDVSPAALRELLERGYDKKYNARGIRRTLEKEVVTPLARAISSFEIVRHDRIVLDYEKDGFVFYNLTEQKESPNGVIRLYAEGSIPTGQLSLPIL
jgi:ATP-dependent Clp protease ATP-binding subunit ClpC